LCKGNKVSEEPTACIYMRGGCTEDEDNVLASKIKYPSKKTALQHVPETLTFKKHASYI
jgi:hypothetical protein